MSAPFNAYTTLGVTPSASATDVKRAYLRLAATSHPDKVHSLLRWDTTHSCVVWSRP